MVLAIASGFPFNTGVAQTDPEVRRLPPLSMSISLETEVELRKKFVSDSNRNVLREDNAAIGILAAVGGRDQKGNFLEFECGSLGITSDSIRGNAFVDKDEYLLMLAKERGVALAKLKEDFEEESLYKVQAGWSDSRMPLHVDWLEENADALDLLVRSCQNASFYIPLDPSKPLRLQHLGLYSRINRAAHGLCDRSRRRASQDDFESSLDDLIAVHRLASHLSHTPLLNNILFAYTVKQTAIHGTSQWLNVFSGEGDLLDMASRKLSQLPSLQPFGNAFASQCIIDLELVNECQVVSHRQEGKLNMEQLAYFSFKQRTRDMIRELVQSGPVDWDRVRGRVFQLTSRMDAAWSGAPGSQQMEQVDDCSILTLKELRFIEERRQNAMRRLYYLFFPNAVTRDNSDWLAYRFVAAEAKAFDRFLELEPRILSELDLLQVGIALVRYRIKWGEYPSSLADDRLDISAANRNDHFQRPFQIYQAPDGATWIYQMGPNGVSDGWIRGDQRFDIVFDDTGFKFDARP